MRSNARTHLNPCALHSTLVPGGDWICNAKGTLIFFSNFSTQQVFWTEAVKKEGSVAWSHPIALTAPDSGLRFNDFELDEARARLVAVLEDHGSESAKSEGGEAEHSIVSIDVSSDSLRGGGKLQGRKARVSAFDLNLKTLPCTQT